MDTTIGVKGIPRLGIFWDFVADGSLVTPLSTDIDVSIVCREDPVGNFDIALTVEFVLVGRALDLGGNLGAVEVEALVVIKLSDWYVGRLER